MIISGADQVEYPYAIDAPAEVWRARSDEDEIAAFETVDVDGVKTVIGFLNRLGESST